MEEKGLNHRYQLPISNSKLSSQFLLAWNEVTISLFHAFASFLSLRKTVGIRERVERKNGEK